MDRAYPVGSTYFNKTDSRNPSIILGIGTWIELGGVVLAGVKTGDTTFADTGEIGAKTHTLTVAEMPKHKHKVLYFFNGSAFGQQTYTWGANGTQEVTDLHQGEAGGDQPHPNIQPTLVGYMWERIS